MKYKIILYVTLALLFGYSKMLSAACINQFSQEASVSEMLANYTSYATLTDPEHNIYEICFDTNFEFGLYEEQKKNIEIIVPPEHTLKISGLRFPLVDQYNPLNMISRDAIFIIIGSNVIFDDVKLNGNGSGAAIQVYGTNNTIKNSTISNFAEGIRVAANASVKLENNIFETIGDFTPDHGLAFDPSFTSPIDSRLVGKKLNAEDPTKVEEVIGKLNLETCDGSVQVYSYKLNIKLQNNLTATCSISNVQEKDTKFTFADGTEEIVKAGTCLFTCSNINDGTNNPAIFQYTSPDGKSYPFAPMPTKTFAELPNVIAFTIPSEIIPSGYTGDGDDTISAGNVVVTGDVPDGNTPSAKAGSTSGDGMVSQGAKMSCTLVKDNSASALNIATLLALTGILLPISARRFFAKAKCRK